MIGWQVLRDLVVSLYINNNKQIGYLINDKALFWRKVKEKKLVNLLEFASDLVITQAAESIIYAYKNAGSREALCRLCKGLFGEKSVSIIDDFNPCVIASISVTNANVDFFYALAESAKTAIASGIDETYAHSDLASLVGYDPLNFFRLFLKPGTSLISVKIN